MIQDVLTIATTDLNTLGHGKSIVSCQSQSKHRVMCQTRTQSHHRYLHIHTSASAASARLSMRLMTRVNDSPEQSFTRNKHKRQLMQQRLFLRAGAQPVSTPSRIPQRWLAVSSRGFSGRGTNSVPHQRCIGTGNSIWTSRIHQLR